MKRIIMMLLSLCLIFSLVACSGKDSPDTPASEAVPETVSIKPEDGFDDAGFTEIAVTGNGKYKFEANDASEAGGVTWEVYLMNEKFEDGFRYISQASTPVTERDGVIKVQAGQYIYIHCSENGFTINDVKNVTKGAEFLVTFIPEGSSADEPVYVTASITPLDGFDRAGFTEIPVRDEGDYRFEANAISGRNDVKWTVYLMDSRFTDSFRYIPRATSPALEGDGTVHAAKGQYFYVGCSENGFSLGDISEVTDGAKLYVSRTTVRNQAPSEDMSLITREITPDEGFDNAGYVEILVPADGLYKFEADGTSDVSGISWIVYLMDSQFEDAVRYIAQAAEPVTERDGVIRVKAGQYLYVYCSENSFTLDDINKVTKGAGFRMTFIPDGSSAAEPVYTTKAVTPEDGFEDAGYVEIPVTETGRYRFVANMPSAVGGVTWNVYVFDEEFTDSYRFISQAGKPVLEKNGEINAYAGQYIYLYCSENGFTKGDISEVTYGAKCLVSFIPD